MKKYFCNYVDSRETDSINVLSHELKLLSNHTIIDWRNFCRNICAIHYINNPQKIGGMSLIIIKII